MDKKVITIKEEDWNDSEHRTREWEKSVEIVRWEHNYETKEYIITYKEK